jgi:two-component system sensor histidine kinase ChiS
MHDETILVLEDDLVTLKGLTSLLQAEGYQVIRATTTNEALAAIRSQQLDLMILDLTLLAEDPFNGVTDGFAFKRWLQTMVPDLDLPIIVHTADMSPSLEARGQAQGINRVLRKGCPISEFLNAVRQVLDERISDQYASQGATDVGS